MVSKIWEICQNTCILMQTFKTTTLCTSQSMTRKSTKIHIIFQNCSTVAQLHETSICLYSELQILLTGLFCKGKMGGLTASFSAKIESFQISTFWKFCWKATHPLPLTGLLGWEKKLEKLPNHNFCFWILLNFARKWRNKLGAKTKFRAKMT